MLAKRGNRSNIWELYSYKESRIFKFLFLIFICKMEPPFAGKFRSICMKNQKHDFSLLSKLMLFRFNRLTLLANIVSCNSQKFQNINLPRVIEHQNHDCVKWTNENVLFGAQNYECLSKKCSTFCLRGVQVWQNIKTFFNVLEAWCHCDFRKIEALKVNKFGRTYHTGGPISRCDELFF